MSCNTSGFDPATSIFAGMTDAELRLWLRQAQIAYLDLLTGNKGVKFSYTQGDGVKTVEYQPTDANALNVAIKTLQQQLGLVGRTRRPIGFAYTR